MRDRLRDFKREQIIEHAIPLFYEQGYTQSTLDEVAKSIGVTKPFIYTYFSNKLELLSHICRQGTEACLAAASEAAGRKGSATERLDHLTRHFAQAVIAHERNIAIYFREQRHLDDESLALILSLQKQFDQLLRRILKDGIEAGEFDIPDLRATTLAIGGLISWIYTWHSSGRPNQFGDVPALMSTLVFRMVEKR